MLTIITAPTALDSPAFSASNFNQSQPGSGSHSNHYKDFCLGFYCIFRPCKSSDVPNAICNLHCPWLILIVLGSCDLSQNETDVTFLQIIPIILRYLNPTLDFSHFPYYDTGWLDGSVFRVGLDW